jgi:hypothetical protein
LQREDEQPQAEQNGGGTADEQEEFTALHEDASIKR